MIKNIISGCLLILVFKFNLNALSADIVLKSYSNLNEPYIELYTFIVNSASSDSIANQQLESLIVITNNDEIVVAEKYLYELSVGDAADLIDIKRFNLPDGNYNLRVEIFDINNTERYFTYSNTFSIDYPKNVFRQSDLYLGFESQSDNHLLNKLNIGMEPLVFEFSRNQKELLIYNELYYLNALEGDLFLTTRLFEDGNDKALKKRVQKLSRSEFVPNMAVFPIDDTPSGSYVISSQVINRDQDVVSEKTIEFKISNSEADLYREISFNSDFETSWIQDLTDEEVVYGIKAIYPKLTFTNTEMVEYVLRSKDPMVKKYFLYKFWLDQSLEYPEALYTKYMEIAAATDKTFRRNVGYGFESDRGYVFLKYGRPNDIVAVEDEPTAPPYEIWIYHHVPQTGQTNVKFLFYNPSLSTNDYSMLHSTARGEINNPRWEMDLYGDDPTVSASRTFDTRSATDGYNRRAREFFDDF